MNRIVRVSAGKGYTLHLLLKRNPDQIGKDRKHWANLYMHLQVRLLQERLLEQEERPTRRRK